MSIIYQLKPLSRSDHSAVRDTYADAIESQGQVFYTKDQISAWASLAWLPGILDPVLETGKGWVVIKRGQVEAFAVRYPMDRLALLYCRGRSARQGYATTLLKQVELEARQEGQSILLAEASSFSYSLLLKCGWKLKAPETISIGGVDFERYRMAKKLD